MAVTSDFIVTIGNSTWDLRKVSSVILPDDSPSTCLVRFIDNPNNTVTLDRVTFLAAWQLALDASLTNKPVTMGGDIGGTSDNAYVKLVRGLSKTLAYNGAGQLIGLTSASGTETFTYNPDGTLASITGTGRYPNKSFGYSGGKLASVTVS